MQQRAEREAPAAGFKPGDHIFLVDGSNFIFRAYFQSINQDRRYNVRSDGLPTGAVRLFCTKLYQFLREGAMGISPTHLAIVFDKTEDSFRKELFPDYKANRSAPPEDLTPQFPLMREAVRAFGLSPVERHGFEADDLIATYACRAVEAGADVLIVSADKDLMQLVRPGIGMYDPASGIAGKAGARPERRIGPDEVLEYFGVPPAKVADVQALAGDSTDNVPGVPGIGVKTAAQLILEFGDLETLLARAGEIRQPKRRESLIEHAERARISKQLVTLDCSAPLDLDADDLAVPEIDGRRLIAFLRAMEFNTLVRRVAEATGLDAAEIEPDPRLKARGELYPLPFTHRPELEGAPSAPTELEGGGAGGPSGVSSGTTPTTGPSPQGGGEKRGIRSGHTPQALAEARAKEAASAKVEPSGYEIIAAPERLAAWAAEALDRGLVALNPEWEGPDPLRGRLTGLALALEPGRAAYLPLRHRAAEGLALEGGTLAQVAIAEALPLLAPLVEDRSVLKVGHNLKVAQHLLKGEGLQLRGLDDVMLISYVLEAGTGGHGLDELSARWLGHQRPELKDLTGSGRARVSFDLVPLERAGLYAAESADVALRLWRVLRPRLVAQGLLTVYETLERPLVDVLARMEARGIKIDRAVLSRLSGEFAQATARLEAEIQEMAGAPFQVGSPAQVGEVLFGRLGLPGGTKTKTGAWATRATALEELAEAGHDLPRRILDWRQLTKLKQTYTDALVLAADRGTDRVHTTYSLASTSTGRLSSTDPNLQNIPIRTEEGRKIRRAFVAAPGTRLISADYSQIELRLLAHYADIAPLKQAFAQGIDIHAMTAAEVFGVPLENMDPQVRRNAKTINFGIIYGISAFGLSSRLGIPRDEAAAYIKLYFERFPGIRDYMDRMKAMAREKGYVTTLFGRRCHYPDIKISNPSLRAFNERAAINAPLQGTAADIIRRAMIRMEPALDRAGLQTRMLLSVHDELVFEAPEEEVEAAIPVIRKVMVGAPLPAVALSVPLGVDARAAADWDGAH